MNNVKFISNEFNVSDATIRNWIKLGVIPDKKMSAGEVQKFKNKFSNGKIKKLTSRANKIHSEKTFIPKEYFSNIKNFTIVEKFVEKLNSSSHNFVLEQKIFLSVILYLRNYDFFDLNNTLGEILDFLSQNKHNKQIYIELARWIETLSLNSQADFEELIDFKLPDDEPDFLGIIYQSLKKEGEKSKSGSYYTPKNVVKNIVNEYVEDGFRVLDPACGTGQFLLQYADKIKSPELIYGFDIDIIAVRIARINLMVKYKTIDFKPNVFNFDYVFDFDENNLFSTKSFGKFDFIATNPPWGASFTKKDKSVLLRKYPEIKSNEIFSYFLNNSLHLLKKKGKLSFVLPVSFLNVAVHKDIRKIILRNSTILKIFEYDKIFKNVFTDVIRIDIKKEKPKNNSVEIFSVEEPKVLNQSEFCKNNNYIIYTKINSVELAIIKKTYSYDHCSLKNNAIFGLGIVTGDNKKFLVEKRNDSNEPVFKGKDIDKYTITPPSFFIKFEPKKLQQVAPIEKYRAKEKLVYRFISKDLIFAYDNNQYLTLNSANILIPAIKNYDVKVILGLLNSKLYNFIFRKKFNSIKVLRFHIENLPIPKLTDNQKNKILNLVQIILQTKIISDELDNYICEIFGLNEVEKQIINNLSVSQT